MTEVGQVSNSDADQRENFLLAGDSYHRVMSELYENGPFKLVTTNGHPDLINRRVRLCCITEPYLDVINALQLNDLITASTNASEEAIFALTSKGVLTAMLLHHKRTRLTRCACSRCSLQLTEAIEELLVRLQQNTSMQLVVNVHSNHPHLRGESSQLCCAQAPFLDAVCDLERRKLLTINQDFVICLSPRGVLSALVLRSPKSKSDLHQRN